MINFVDLRQLINSLDAFVVATEDFASKDAGAGLVLDVAGIIVDKLNIRWLLSVRDGSFTHCRISHKDIPAIVAFWSSSAHRRT